MEKSKEKIKIMASEVSNELYFRLIDKKSGVARQTAKAVKELLDYILFNEPLPQKKLKKFRDCGVIDKNGKLYLDDPTSLTEWILISLCYEGKVERIQIDR